MLHGRDWSEERHFHPFELAMIWNQETVLARFLGLILSLGSEKGD